MSSKKRKATDRDNEGENDESRYHLDNPQRLALASLLANDAAIRSMLRSENLLLASFARQGLMGTVATAAALWIQDHVLLPCSITSGTGRVEWSALRARVAGGDDNGTATTIIGKAIIDSLPETIPITNQKRKQLDRVKRGETKKLPPAQRKQSPSLPSTSRSKIATSIQQTEAAATMASMQERTSYDGEEHDPTEIIEDQEDYD